MRRQRVIQEKKQTIKQNKQNQNKNKKQKILHNNVDEQNIDQNNQSQSEIIEPAIKSMKFREKRGTRMKQLMNGNFKVDNFWDANDKYFGGNLQFPIDDDSQDLQYQQSSSGRDQFDSDFDQTDSYPQNKTKRKNKSLNNKRYNISSSSINKPKNGKPKNNKPRKALFRGQLEIIKQNRVDNQPRKLRQNKIKSTILKNPLKLIEKIQKSQKKSSKIKKKQQLKQKKKTKQQIKTLSQQQTTNKKNKQRQQKIQKKEMELKVQKNKQFRCIQQTQAKHIKSKTIKVNKLSLLLLPAIKI